MKAGRSSQKTERYPSPFRPNRSARRLGIRLQIDRFRRSEPARIFDGSSRGWSVALTRRQSAVLPRHGGSVVAQPLCRCGRWSIYDLGRVDAELLAVEAGFGNRERVEGAHLALDFDCWASPIDQSLGLLDLCSVRDAILALWREPFRSAVRREYCRRNSFCFIHLRTC